MPPPSPTPQARRRVLVVDDDPGILRAIQLALGAARLDVITATGLGSARLLLLGTPDIAVILCDHMLPDGTGVEFLREIKNEYPAAVRLIMTGAHVFDKNIALQAINAGEIYRFLAKPFTNEELVAAVLQSLDRFNLQQENIRLQERLAEQNLSLQREAADLSARVSLEEDVSRSFRDQAAAWRRAFKDSVALFIHVAERLDKPLHAHGQRVAALAVAIGRDLRLPPPALEHLELAGSLHDFGLLGATPALRALQRTPDRAGQTAEHGILLAHPTLTAGLLDFIPHPEVITAIAAHHELLDGSGYPNGLAGERIPQLAQVLAVADAYEESTTDRDYALSAIEIASGRLFSAEIVRSLARVLQSGLVPLRSERPVLIGELLPGMLLTSPVYTSAGMLLVRQGQVLTEGIIRRLQQHDQLQDIQQNVYVEA